MKSAPVPTDLCLDGPLWHFAGRFWSRPVAQKVSLALQERGWSVTDILCALWLSQQGRVFYGMKAEPVILWRSQVTEALREVRRIIGKGNPATDQARDCIARSELEAERVELALACRSLTQEAAPAIAPQESTAKTLALENLQAAAPEKAMDIETSTLLDTLIDELQSFAEGGTQSC